MSRRDLAEKSLEQIEEDIKRLTQERTLKQSIVDDFSLQARRVEIESERKLEAVRAEIEAKCALLRLDVAPLQELKATCQALRADIVRLRRDKDDAINTLTAERAATMKETNELIQKASARLAKVEEAIDVCKKKVASL